MARPSKATSPAPIWTRANSPISPWPSPVGCGTCWRWTIPAQLRGVTLGDPDSVAGKLPLILSNPAIFGVDLIRVGLAGKIEAFLREMLSGPGAVRSTLQKHLD